jgi:hypothetical protein
MLVPEAAMYVDDGLMARENNIRPPWKTRLMKAEAQSMTM